MDAKVEKTHEERESGCDETTLCKNESFAVAILACIDGKLRANIEVPGCCIHEVI